METSNENWSALSEDIIAELVGHLKRTRRWSRDGRSLRALNKHWCCAMNRHIVEVRPHSSRVIHEDDIDSLSKFRNLTALDTVMLEGYDDAQTKSRCLKLVEILSKLPHLKRLRSKNFLHHVEETAIQSLGSIKEIEIEESKAVDSDVLSKISELEIETLDGCFSISALNDFIPKMPMVKFLSISIASSGSMRDFQKLIPKTDTIDAISVASPSGLLDPTIAEMHNLVSLKIYKGVPRNLESLVGLLKLTSLEMAINKEQILTSDAFHQISRSLISLKIHGIGVYGLPSNFLREAKALENFSLYGILHLEKEFIDNLRKLSLKSLSFIDFNFLPDYFFFDSFTTLEHLTLLGCWFPDDIAGMLSPMQNLKSLAVGSEEIEKAKLLNEIRHLSSLESLEILYGDNIPFSFEDFKVLEDLPNLSSLSFRDFESWQSEEIIGKDVLTDLEELTLEGWICRRVCFAVQYMETVRDKAPHIKINDKMTRDFYEGYDEPDNDYFYCSDNGSD